MVNDDDEDNVEGIEMRIMMREEVMVVNQVVYLCK
jgi:hypothetical protein